MSRVTQLFFCLGGSLGVVLTILIQSLFPLQPKVVDSEEPNQEVAATLHAGSSADVNGDLVRVKERVTYLEQQLNLCKGSTKLDQKNQEDKVQSSPTQPEPSGSSWKVSAIEKFVPLTDDQRTRLLKSYSLPTNSPEREPLDKIIGVDHAQYYQEQVQAAFSRIEQREFQKELVWLSRQLNLDSSQESRLTKAFAEIDEQLERDKVASVVQAKKTATERAAQLALESKEREKLRSVKAKEILTPDQYEGYIREQSDSPEADMAVFHGE